MGLWQVKGDFLGNRLLGKPQTSFTWGLPKVNRRPAKNTYSGGNKGRGCPNSLLGGGSGWGWADLNLAGLLLKISGPAVARQPHPGARLQELGRNHKATGGAIVRPVDQV